MLEDRHLLVRLVMYCLLLLISILTEAEGCFGGAQSMFPFSYSGGSAPPSCSGASCARSAAAPSYVAPPAQSYSAGHGGYATGSSQNQYSSNGVAPSIYQTPHFPRGPIVGGQQQAQGFSPPALPSAAQPIFTPNYQLPVQGGGQQGYRSINQYMPVLQQTGGEQFGQPQAGGEQLVQQFGGQEQFLQQQTFSSKQESTLGSQNFNGGLNPSSMNTLPSSGVSPPQDEISEHSIQSSSKQLPPLESSAESGLSGQESGASEESDEPVGTGEPAVNSQLAPNNKDECYETDEEKDKSFKYRACFTNQKGFQCCHPEMNSYLEEIVEMPKHVKNWKGCNNQRMARDIQKHAEEKFEMKFETFVGSSNVCGRHTFYRDWMCKTKLKDGKIVLVYAHPVANGHELDEYEESPPAYNNGTNYANVHDFTKGNYSRGSYRSHKVIIKTK